MNNEYEFSVCYEYDKNNNNPVKVLNALSSLLVAVTDLDKDIALTINSGIDNSILLKQVEDGSIILKLLSKIVIPETVQLSDPLKQDSVLRYIKGAKEEVFSGISRTNSEKPEVVISEVKANIQTIADKEGITDCISYSAIGNLALVKDMNSIIDVVSMTNENETISVNQTVSTKESNVELSKGSVIPFEPFLQQEIAKTLTSTNRMIVKPKIIDLQGNQKWKVIFDNKPFEVKILDTQWLETIHSGDKKIGANDLIEADFEITTHYDIKGEVLSSEYSLTHVYQ